MTTSRPPKLAATVVLLQQEDTGLAVLLQRRAPTMAFMPGMLVFPGGAVEPADVDAAQAGPSCDDPRELCESLAPAAWAALRECGEEADISIVHPDGTPAPDKLVPFGRWVTPPFERRRYDTWFFATEAPLGQGGNPDGNEALTIEWWLAADLLLAHQTGEVGLAPPTLWVIMHMARHESIASFLTWCRTCSLDIVEPELVSTEPPTLAVPGHTQHGADWRLPPWSTCVLHDGRWEWRP
jgi:8-oxo-dGTP pyrophosphatase MutT (NUDIX family)